MSEAKFDLSKYELTDTAEMIVQNASGTGDLLGVDGKPVVFTFYGHGSNEAVTIARKHGQKASLRFQQAVRGKTIKDEAKIAEDEETERLCALTKSISPNFPVKPEEVYSNHKLCYITSQAQDFLKRMANFSKG